MKLRTVKDLKSYLQSQSLSPERFSALCGISNMTIRRWVKNDDATLLPQKYWPLFDHALVDHSVNEFQDSQVFAFQDGFKELEKHVHSMGQNTKSEETLKTEFTEKTADINIGKGLIDKVKLLFKALTSPQISNYHRTLVLGAIVYFISPIDLIPDATPVIGYLDDYAVVTMVLTTVTPSLLVRKASPGGADAANATESSDDV